MMALHIEIPAVPGREPSRTHEVTRPPHSLPPRLDCSREDWRQANDYVRTPCHLTPADPTHRRTTLKDAPTGCVHYNAQSTSEHLVLAEVPTPDLKEPEPRLPSKQNGSGHGPSTSASGSCGGSYSVCPRCHRCRCEKCRGPRQLPRSWCCDTWECSGESAVDCMSCMCCVRGTFYHCCQDSEEENDYADNPCGCCKYPRCLLRWLFIIIVSLFLPCLIFYWPMRGALTLVTCCYNSCSGGCRCDREFPASRPLIEAENASA